MALNNEYIQVYRCLASHAVIQPLLGRSFWDGQFVLNTHLSASDPPRSTFSQTIRESQGAFILHFPSPAPGYPAKLLLLAYNRNQHVGSPTGAPAVEAPQDFASHWLLMARAHLLIEGPTFNITRNDPEFAILTGPGRS